MRRNAALFVGIAVLACGDGTGPTDVPFGVTTFVVLVNPRINDANQQTTPTPETTQSGVSASVADGPSGTTDASGVVVLSPIAPGTTKTISLSGGGFTGQVNIGIADKDLREVAVALTQSGAQVMANVQYAFGGAVVEITPSMSLTQVNDALSQSNTIVFFKAGTYTGDLQFSGSNVTLFGEGNQGGSVTLNGNVTVGGSQNRVRGARITGNLSVPGSNFGMSFSRVSGTFNLAGSSGTLLNNQFCSTVTISGSGTRLLGNAGLAPITPVPATGC